MDIKIIPYADIPSPLKSGVDHWNHQEFELDETFGKIKFALPDWQLFGLIDEQMAVMLEIHQRTILAGGQPIRVGGVSGVVTMPDYRGQGVGSIAVKAATDFIRTTIQPPYALLICKPYLVNMYASLGYQAVDKPVIFTQPDGSAHQFPDYIQPMIYPMTDAPWPRGAIHMQGLPW